MRSMRYHHGDFSLLITNKRLQPHNRVNASTAKHINFYLTAMAVMPGRRLGMGCKGRHFTSNVRTS